MPHEIISLSRIEREAKAAAKKYSNINDACPHPFQSAAGKAFKVAFTEARKEIEAKQVERRPGLRALVEKFVRENPRWSSEECVSEAKVAWTAKFTTTKVAAPSTRSTRITLHPVLAERASQLVKLQASLGQEPGKVPPATIHAASTTAPYDGAELTAPAVRAHADTPQGIPSRCGDRLHYRGGYVTDLTGNPIATGA